MGQRKWLQFLVPSVFVVAFAIVVSGCGGGATGGGGGGGSAASSTAVSGAVEVLQKHLSALGISSVGLTSVAPASAGLSSRVLSIPLQAVETSKVTYSNLGTGADLNVSVNVGSDLKVPEAQVEIPGAAIATYTLQPINSTKKLVMKSICLQPETEGSAVAYTCGEASTGTILGIFGNADVKAAITAAAAVAPKEVAQLVAAVAKLINENAPQLQNSSLIQDTTTVVDSDTGLPVTAAEEIAVKLGDEEDMETNVNVAKNIHSVQKLNEGSDADKLGARKELGRIFIGFVTDPRSAGPLVDALAKDTRKFTFDGLIPKLVAMEGRTVSVQAQSVADAINSELKMMSDEFAKAGDQGFKRQEGGPPPHEMMALLTYMKTITGGTLVVSVTTEWDYFALPAIVGLIAGQIAPGVDMMKTLAAHDIVIETAGFDMERGDIFIGSHPRPYSEGATLGDLSQKEVLYIEVGGFGPVCRNAVSVTIQIGTLDPVALSKVDLSGIQGRGPECLYIASPDGKTDEHWKHEFGIQPQAAAAVVILIDDTLRGQIDSDNNLSLTASLKDSSGTEIFSRTQTHPIFVGGPPMGGGPGPVDMQFTSPAMPAMDQPPELMPSGTTAIELIVSSTLSADQLPNFEGKQLTADSLRYRFRIERMPAPTMEMGPPVGSEFQRQEVWTSRLLKKPKVEANVTLSNGIYSAHCEAVAVITENGQDHELPVGFAMVPFMVGTAEELFGGEGSKFKDFLGSGDEAFKLEDIKSKFEVNADVVVTVKAKDIPSGLTAPIYAVVILQPDFRKGENMPTVKYLSKIDSTTLKATVTIPMADIDLLHGAWDLGLFVDKDSDGTYDFPTDFTRFDSGEPLMHPFDQHPVLGRGGKIHLVGPGDFPSDSNLVTGDYEIKFEGPPDASAFQGPESDGKFQSPQIGPGFENPGTNP